MRPPDLQCEKGRPGRQPQSQIHLPCTADTTEPVREFQARSLRQIYAFCHATACTIASLAYGVAR
jgi:hypothetical protein